MKVVILAGGYGTRIAEESHLRPKPMIEIGGKPILWHIMKEYSRYGYNDFIICAGYKQYVIKEWFANYFLHSSDVTFDFKEGKNNMIVHEQRCEPWAVTIVDTGLDTMTGGRIKRIQKYVGDETFMLTYGDGVCDVDMRSLLEYHREMGKTVTITSVMIEHKKGFLDVEDGIVRSFREKSNLDNARINGGYMVLEPAVFSYLKDDATIFEGEPMDRLAAEGQLAAFWHNGFWQCMDNKREMDMLERLIKVGKAPWMKWKE